MKDYYINSELLKTKTTNAYKILYDIRDLLNKIESETKSAFGEINSHDELGKQTYETIKAEIKDIEEYMDKYKKFGGATDLPDRQRSACSAYEDPRIMLSDNTAKYGGFPGEYVQEVDGKYLAEIQSNIARLRDSKLADIRVDNNIGATSEMLMPSGTILNPNLSKRQLSKDKIGIEDLFKYGRISLAMQKEYKEMEADIYAYNDSLYKYESEFNNDPSHSAYQKKLLYDQINDMIIDSYDKYINKMITQANFDYATNAEGTIDSGLDLTGLAGAKMLVEGLSGKNYITNEEYSDSQRGIMLGTLAAGGLVGKIVSKIGSKSIANEEIESVEKNSGFVLSANGTGEFDNLFKKRTDKIVGENKVVVEGGSKGGVPVKDKTTASNGLDYQSNPKHTPGQPGNRPNAGIEPKNSLDLFGESTPSTLKLNQRYTFDRETNTLHRFFEDGNGNWHWSGSTNQGANSITGSQVPNDIKKLFNLPKKGW